MVYYTLIETEVSSGKYIHIYVGNCIYCISIDLGCDIPVYQRNFFAEDAGGGTSKSSCVISF